MEKFEKFRDYLGAGYPILWVHTPEEIRAIAAMVRDLKEMPDDPKRSGFWWDLGKGWCELTVNGKSNDMLIKVKDRDVSDPNKLMQKFESMVEGSVVFLPDFHLFLNSRNMMTLCRQIKNMAPELTA